MLRIGLDLDNTIVDYSASFKNFLVDEQISTAMDSRDKTSVKALLQGLGGDLLWQKCQFHVYSFQTKGSALADGLGIFLKTCNTLNDQVELFIVSHKSRYAAYDVKKTKNLRQVAIDWLNQRGIIQDEFIKENNIFFEDTITKKLNRIEALELDYFVDDLLEILESKHFPARTIPICFTKSEHSAMKTAEDFHQITNIVFKQNDH